MESKGRIVEVAANLVLHLQHIGEVPPRWDWTVCSINSILPRIPPLLNAIPGCESIKYISVYQFNKKIITFSGIFLVNQFLIIKK